MGPRAPDDAKSVRDYCWKCPPEDLARHILEHVKPWTEVLSNYLDTLGGMEVEDVLAKFEISGLDVAEILRQLHHGTRLRVIRIQAVTQAFQWPETVVGVDRVGYDSERARFVLPQFTIETGGEVKRLKYPVLPEPVPAAKLQPPEVLSPEEIDRVKNRCNETMTEVFWATAACVLANILARVYHLKPYGIALQGHVASEFGRAVARALGCIDSCPRTAAEVKRALLAEQRHDWPVLTEVSPSLQRKYRRQFFESSDEGRVRNSIAAVDWVSAKLLGMQYDWHTISTQGDGTQADDTLAVTKLLIPAYLKNLRERQLDLGNHPNGTGCLVGDVLQDLSRFAKDRYGDPEAVLSAWRAIEVNDTTSRAKALADLLAYFVRNQKLEIREEMTTRRKPALIQREWLGSDGLLLPYGALDKLVKESPVSPPSADQLYDLLTEADVLLGDDEDGVILRRDWFEEHCRVARAQQSGMLKVMG